MDKVKDYNPRKTRIDTLNAKINSLFDELNAAKQEREKLIVEQFTEDTGIKVGSIVVETERGVSRYFKVTRIEEGYFKGAVGLCGLLKGKEKFGGRERRIYGESKLVPLNEEDALKINR